MKKTTGRVICTALEVLFYLAVPLAFIFWQYASIENTPETVSFKLGLGGCIALLLVFLVLKKLFLDKYVKRITDKIADYEVRIDIEVEQEKIVNIENGLKHFYTLEVLFNMLLPAILILILFVACKGLETQLVKFSGAVGFIGLSMLVGFVVSLIKARMVVSKRRKDEAEKN